MTIRTWAATVSAQGLDVSNYSGSFDWAGAVATVPGLAFGVFRLTEGLGGAGMNSPDPTAGWNHAQIAQHGLRRGAYHFLHPGLDGAAQARYFVQEYGKLGLTGQDMLWLDNETAGASPQAVAACAQAFMRELDALCPHNPRGVYTYIEFAKQGNCQGLGGWPLWLSYPALSAPAPPPPWVNWKFWQWGFRNGFDADAFNGSAQALDAWIASYAPPVAKGPFRHVADGTYSLAQIARARNTTVAHLVEVTAAAVQPADLAAIAASLAGAQDQPLPAGFVWYSTNP
jgi:lysozyme